MRPTVLALLMVVPLLFAGSAAAFAPSEAPVRLRFDAGHAPMTVAAGALHAKGEVRESVMAVGLRDAELGPIPRLVVAEVSGDGTFSNATYENVTLVAHDGGLLWRRSDNGTLRADLSMDFGVLLAMSGGEGGNRSGPEGGGLEGPGIALAGSPIAGRLEAAGGDSELAFLDAAVTLRASDGAPVPGWDGRRLNAGASPDQMREGPDGNRSGETPGLLFLRAEGAFASQWRSRVLMMSPDPAAGMRVQVREAPEERFTETLGVLTDAMSRFEGDASDPKGGMGHDNPLEGMGPLVGILNGATLLINQGDGDRGSVQPLEARVGDAPVERSGFALLRGGDVELAWTGSEVHAMGQPALVLTGDGLAAPATAALGPVPILSIVLWALAVGAIVVYYVKKPPMVELPRAIRLTAFATHAVALLLAFYLWDRSFAATFGTSALTLAFSGMGAEGLPFLGAVLAVELIPWTLVILLIALPVRILLGIAFRYLAKGKGLKGVAKAGGLAALVLLGPFYALWLLNQVLAPVLAFFLPSGP